MTNTGGISTRIRKAESHVPQLRINMVHPVKAYFVRLSWIFEA